MLGLAITEYPFGRRVDVPHNRFALEDFIEVFHPMSSANINAPSTNTRGKFHVVWMIAHHKGSAKIEAVVFGSLIQEIWFRLDAHATVSTLVRADVGFQNLRSHLRQSGNHVRVDTLYVVNAYHPFGNARLVRYDEKKELILEFFNASTVFGKKTTSDGLRKCPRSSISVPSRSRNTAGRN